MLILSKIRTVCFALAVCTLLCTPALSAQESATDDKAWWGQSGATPEPVKDSVRDGYWWWPTDSKSNEADAELWGNRGVPYGDPAEALRAMREVPVMNDLLFEFDRAVLKTEALTLVDLLISVLQKHPNDTLEIAGHTCSTGPSEYNMDLSQRRAEAVQKYVRDKGIDASRIHTASYGETRPALPNDTLANRRQNRRAVFSILLGEEQGD
ncbi:MAG: OmpA family protein [Candidatus Hydrogenedentes bacterium]|nr:OmpA family protein [Candidatus Hydrogenedentota bacterium]